MYAVLDLADRANAGKPSPSRPLGAVVTDTTSRSTAVGSGAGTRGTIIGSALIAACTLLEAGRVRCGCPRQCHVPLDHSQQRKMST
jgi:hypothetical protein